MTGNRCEERQHPSCNAQAHGLENANFSEGFGSRVSIVVHSKKHPTKANPVKAGDAKLWVFRQINDQDRQAAEDNKEQFFGIIRLA